MDESTQTLKGLVFVVTGSLNHFYGRSAMKETIEQKGGKVTFTSSIYAQSSLAPLLGRERTYRADPEMD